MRKQSKRCLIALSVAVGLLLAAVGVLWARPDWSFSIEKALRQSGSLAWEPIALGDAAEEWTLSQLRKADSVTESTVLMLVNADHPLPENYVPLLKEYNGARMHPEMIAAYVALRDEVEQRTGMRIYVSADYRTREEQQQIILESEDGIAAPLGCSEHEAGLALDVYVKGYGGMAFLKTDAGREVDRICGEYGFIIRYPEGKEEITGISYEPWHLRYVGAPHASCIMESGLAYEEYLECLRPEVWYAYGDYRVLKTGWERVMLPVGWKLCQISSDNAGHTVLTLKMA